MTTRSEQVPEQLDRVVIRFAGDSGDGMQLTGDRFTTSSARCSATTWRRSRTSRPRSGRRPAPWPASRLPGPHLRPRHHDAGRRPERPGGDEPGRAAGQHRARCPRGRRCIVNVDAFDERNLTKAGYDANPLTDGSLGAFTVYEVPMTSITQEVCKEAGVKPRDAERSKNFFALGLVSWLYTRPTEPTDRVDRQAVRRASPRWPRRTPGRSGPASTSARRPSCSTSNYEVRAAHVRARRVRPGHRQPGPGLGADRRRPAGRACRCSWAATRSRRRRTSSTSCRGARSSASGRSRPRTRSPASAPRSARLRRRRSA